MKRSKLMFLILLAVITGCTTTRSNVDNSPGKATMYQDVNSASGTQGVGIESQDINSMTDQMIRDMLKIQELMNRREPPRIILDAAYFENESLNRINKNIITRKIKTGLSRASRGKMIFVGREFANMVEKERDLKRTGVTDNATTGMAKKVYGADYRMAGSITSHDAVAQNGETTRFTVIFFTLVDMETGAEIWNNEYQFKKSAQDDVIYR